MHRHWTVALTPGLLLGVGGVEGQGAVRCQRVRQSPQGRARDAGGALRGHARTEPRYAFSGTRVLMYARSQVRVLSCGTLRRHARTEPRYAFSGTRILRYAFSVVARYGGTLVQNPGTRCQVLYSKSIVRSDGLKIVVKCRHHIMSGHRRSLMSDYLQAAIRSAWSPRK